MVTQIAKGKEFVKNTYWAAVGMATATMLSLQPVLATGTGTSTIWNRFSTILKPLWKKPKTDPTPKAVRSAME